MQQMLYRKLEYFKEVLDLARLALACTFLCQAVKRHSQAHKLFQAVAGAGGFLTKSIPFLISPFSWGSMPSKATFSKESNSPVVRTLATPDDPSRTLVAKYGVSGIT